MRMILLLIAVSVAAGVALAFAAAPVAMGAYGLAELGLNKVRP